jgi:hypothetical protein
MQKTVLLGLVAAAAWSSHESAAGPPTLKVSDNGRYLVTTDGQPFFWLGDTAWRFIQKASRADVDDQPSALRYFAKRSAQGFNVHRSFIGWMRKGETFKYGAHIPWYESLDAPGANQMRHLRALMESNSLIDHVPDASLLADAGPRGKGHLRATRSGNGESALVYSPLGKPIPVRLDRFATGRIFASWFDPRTGESTPCGTFETPGARTFKPPSSGEDHDWVLVLRTPVRGK